MATIERSHHIDDDDSAADPTIRIRVPRAFKREINEYVRARGTDVSKLVRRLIEQDMSSPVRDENPAVPLLGYIPAGPALEVRPFPDHTMVENPPFRLADDCYALAVVGDSMESRVGVSIPDGSYAFFSSAQIPAWGSIVHVEFPRSDGSSDVTLKKFVPQPDGSVHFEPLNPKHETIVRRADEEFSIRGVFLRAWDGK